MDKSPDVVGHHRPSYILTFDLPEKVQFFRTLGLEVPQVDDPIFKDIRGKAIRQTSLSRISKCHFWRQTLSPRR